MMRPASEVQWLEAKERAGSHVRDGFEPRAFDSDSHDRDTREAVV